jgi:hypothetical protein
LYWDRPLGLVVLGSYVDQVRRLRDRLAENRSVA